MVPGTGTCTGADIKYMCAANGIEAVRAVTNSHQDSCKDYSLLNRDILQ